MSADREVIFTVFTATYNRRNLLADVYRSLCLQTFRSFEWIIGDDGSTDDTGGLVAQWANDGWLRIRYFYQPNRGKHVAQNHALTLANGLFFAVLDSDDTLVPHALERLLRYWNTIPAACRDDYSGVTCLCRDEQGRILGRSFPGAVLDCRHFEAHTIYGASGEKWGFHRTAILKQYPFPEFPGETYCPDGLLWNRIGRSLKVRHVNEALRIYRPQQHGVIARADAIRAKSSNLARCYYREYVDLSIPFRFKFRSLVNYVRYSLHADVGIRRLVKEVRYPACSFVLYPLGWAVFCRDRARLTEEGGAHTS
jgi:glycosyltransferase involved in cell wall biosynthesis